MKFSTEVGTDLDRAAQLLLAEQPVALPTETVYGLAGLALSETSLGRIFTAKDRPKFDPLIVHVQGVAQAQQLVTEWPPLASQLAEAFWPGPLTLLLPKATTVPHLATAGLPHVGVRCPAHPGFQEVLQRVARPLAAPSANLFGHTSPTTAQHVQQQLDGRIAYIVDGGAAAVGLESTVVQLNGETLQVLRQGAVTVEQLQAYGPVQVQAHSSSQPASPGQLQRHYAPALPLTVGHVADLGSPQSDTVYVFFQRVPAGFESSRCAVLAPSGNLAEAASNFFSMLHRMGASEARHIWAEWLPEHGLGRAMNDKLKRASISG